MLAGDVPALVAVYPSADRVPRRLLRVTVVFARPVDALAPPEFGLRRGDGSAIEAPFTDPPLWSADSRTVTLLLDPSRQKLGLRNHDAHGFVLPARGTITLTAGGATLRVWRIDGDACPPLDPSRWQLGEVRAGTHAAFNVAFPAPVDALSAPYLAVADAAGNRVPGVSTLLRGERAWRFTPAAPWSAGATLVVHPRFENPCGDEAGDPFEHRAGSAAGARPLRLSVPVRAAQRRLPNDRR